MRRAHEANPDDRFIQNFLADYLVRDQKEKEAADIASKMVSAATGNPDALNNAAYVMAEANGDLALAEKTSKESLDILDSQTGRSTITEANGQSFRLSSLLAASWDTLGYVLVKEGKLDEANGYLEAAWNNLARTAIGLHYGELLEKQGKRQDALRIYDVASSTLHPSAPDPVEQDLRAGISRLTAAGIKSTIGEKGQSAQELRTFKFKLASPSATYWSSIYRLHFSAVGLQDVMHVGIGLAKRGVDEQIRKTNLPRLVPDTSKGRILRDALVTCSSGQSDCFMVLMPMGSIEGEHVQQ